jgi:hypothetical protein
VDPLLDLKKWTDKELEELLEQTWIDKKATMIERW